MMRKTLLVHFYRTLLAVLLAWAWTPATATSYIKDVQLVGGGEDDIAASTVTLTQQGWKMIGKDLNDGAGGDYIHLFYKLESIDDGFNYGSITGFVIANNYSDKIEYEGRSYFPVPYQGGSSFVASKGNVNNGTGGTAIYLYYTRDFFPDQRVVTDITFSILPKGAVRSIDSSTFSDWGYSLNSGNKGDLIFMHVATATALEPVRIGDGTAGTDALPIYLSNDYYPYSISQQIYTAEEIGTAGTIKALSFYYRTNASFSIDTVLIFLKHTDKDSFAGPDLDPVKDFTKVYKGPFAASGEGWLTVRLDDAFEYDGNQNLMVCCYKPVSATQKGKTFSFHYANNRGRRMSSATPIDTAATLTGSDNVTQRNDIRINIVPNPYRNPANLAVTALTEKSASVSWSAPAGTHPTITRYEWQYKKVEDAAWSALASTPSTTVPLSDLTAFKEYLFRVKIIYDGGESSFSLLRFVTAVSLPYTCGFENGMPGWSQVNYNHYYNIDYTGICEEARHEGSYGYKFEHYSDETPQYLICPRLPGAGPVRVSFYYRNTSTSASQYAKFKVGYSDSTSDISDFHWEDELTAGEAQWLLYDNDFPSNTRFIAVQSYAWNTDLYLDDFRFEAYSSLARPTGLSVSELGEQQVSLKWNAVDGATDYAYQYRRLNDSDWSSEATVNSAAATLGNLTANTTYIFRVKARYTNGTSNYVTFQFLTEGPMVTIPHYQDFENGMEGWRLEQRHGRSGITTGQHHDGSYGFEFDEGSPEAQFLRSPLLDGNAAKVISFYYKNYAVQQGSTLTSYASSFRAGWSTKTNSLNDFKFTAEVEAVNGQWNHYSLQVPEDVKYVLIMVKDQTAWLYVDDISITEVPRPVATLATVREETQYIASFYDGSRNWQLPQGGLAYTVEKEGDDYVFYCIGDVIPSGTPVIILLDKQPGDTGSTKAIALSLSGTRPTPRPYNILQGSDGPVDVSQFGGKTVYVLGIDNNKKWGFYPFSGNTIPAGKAYFVAE